MRIVDQSLNRDKVFVWGGFPTVTYVDRSALDMERKLARAIASPNQIVSLAGPSKTGKTVLCRHVLGQRQYVWIEGGQAKSAAVLWEKICYELNYPRTIEKTVGREVGAQAGVNLSLPGFVISASGSQLDARETKRTYEIDSMATALRHLQTNKIALVIDDFHYIVPEARAEILRNLKGAIFAGLPVILVSVTHRTFDAIKAEPELTGRFVSVEVPEWSLDELKLIPEHGFPALNMKCGAGLSKELAEECQSSPFLMQRMCWEVCFDNDVDFASNNEVVVRSIDLHDLYTRIAKDAALPVYLKLVAGPQIGKSRKQRPKRAGGTADVYEAVMLAVASTGPKSKITYAELRTALATVLEDEVPQRNEITNALKQIGKISQSLGRDAGVDWDDEQDELSISDPYLRFFLRWEIREGAWEEGDARQETAK